MARRKRDEENGFQDTMRRSSYFPNAAASKGYSLDPRFTGILQPSPTGSYYNPARYAGQGFGQQQLNRIQGNLATNYMKDLEFNRLANPNYQPTIDTGYSSTAAFGSGRASPATVRNYANQYGSITPEGNITYTTPSGGTVSFKPMNRGKPISPQEYLKTNPFSGGVQGGGAAPNSAVPTSPALQQFDLNQAYAKGQGAPSPTIQQGPGGQYRVSGGVAAPYSTPNALQQFGSALATAGRGIGTFAANLYNRNNELANRGMSGQTSPQNYAFYNYNPSPVPMQERRYYEF